MASFRASSVHRDLVDGLYVPGCRCGLQNTRGSGKIVEGHPCRGPEHSHLRKRPCGPQVSRSFFWAIIRRIILSGLFYRAPIVERLCTGPRTQLDGTKWDKGRST